jgi:hypothetical protein
MPLEREYLDVLLRIFDDQRSLIAALKVQRWEVVKWAATLNVALAAASAGFDKAHWAFFLAAIFVTLLGLLLLTHYNSRVTTIRANFSKLNEYIRENVFHVNAVVGLSLAGQKARIGTARSC